MGYQDLPWQKGSSHSFDKLLALSLPPLKGKTLLDVGCNTGYFCGWAHFQGALRVRGIDNNRLFIEQARAWFPGCSFTCADWSDLGEGVHDIVLCLSALHYADDQALFIDSLMSRVAPGGMLVLELGVAEGDGAAFVPVERRITESRTDARLFPTAAKVAAMLGKYSHKHMGRSVRQAGDPAGRHVYHVHHRRPYAMLLLDRHYSGKSSVVRTLFRPDIFTIAGESVYHDIADGKIAAPEELRRHMRYVEGTRHMQPPRITGDICRAGLLRELAAVFTGLAGRRDFILEHYVPRQFHDELCSLIDEAGYFVVAAATLAGTRQPWTTLRLPYARYTAYLENLKARSDIDEAAYLAANPDVAEAVKRGEMPGARFHYWHYGKREKRPLRPSSDSL